MKDKKKYFSSIEFKLEVLNILICSKVFEKVSLYIHIFDVKFYNIEIFSFK
jgi:hypothetical protein